MYICWTHDTSKLILDPAQIVEFLGLTVNTNEIELRLPAEKNEKNALKFTVVPEHTCLHNVLNNNNIIHYVLCIKDWEVVQQIYIMLLSIIML